VKVKQGLLFLQKKKQKNSLSLARAGDRAGNPTPESFLLLFFKKEVLPFLT
jgi:hypothetical protein